MPRISSVIVWRGAGWGVGSVDRQVGGDEVDCLAGRVPFKVRQGKSETCFCAMPAYVGEPTVEHCPKRSGSWSLSRIFPVKTMGLARGPIGTILESQDVVPLHERYQLAPWEMVSNVSPMQKCASGGVTVG